MGSSEDHGTQQPIVPRDSLLPAAAYKAPQTIAQRRIATVWAAALHVDRVGIDDDFFELGGESMTATLICAELQRLTGRRAEPALLNEAPTVATFAGAIEGDLRTDASRSLIEIRPGGDRPPLVIVHGVDGQIMFVRRVAWVMPPDQPIYGIQARGMDGRHPPHRDRAAMVADYADQIATAFSGREIYLAGYCLGGALAVGVAHELRKRDVKCLGLVLIDPPVEQHARRDEDAGVRALHEWYATLAARIAPFVQWHPELAAHYGPGGEGLRQAKAVMAALTDPTANYQMRPIDLPGTVIWSEERAQQRGGHEKPHELIMGPCTSHIVRHPRGFVTHSRLLQGTVREVGSLIRQAIGLPPLDIKYPAAARRPGRPTGAAAIRR